MKLITRLTFVAIIFTLSFFFLIFTFKKIFLDDTQSIEISCYHNKYQSILSPPIVTSPKTSDNMSWIFQNDLSKMVTSYGTPRKNKVYLTIGIPSIQRVVKSVYLMETLQHLSSSIPQEQKQKITCVVFLCDSDASFNQITKDEILKNFKEEMQSGFIQVITLDSLFYPQPSYMKQTFNDPFYRIKWRTKQVFDFNVLFRYCSSLSQYHIQIEDDTRVAADLLSQVKSFVSAVTLKLDMQASSSLLNSLSNSSVDVILNTLQSRFHSSKRWTLLEFSRLGFIGKLFRSENLNNMAIFYSMFYDEQPIDWLVNYFVLLSGQHQTHQHIPSLFQHFGLKSSLISIKDNGLQDKLFDANYSPILAPLHLRNSLPALVFSSVPSATGINTASFPSLLPEKTSSANLELLKSRNHSSAHNFYIANPHFLFETHQPQTSDRIDLVFFTATNITAITMETGINGKACPTGLVLSAGKRVEKVIGSGSVHLVCQDLQFLCNVDRCLTSLSVSLSQVTCLSVSVNSLQNSSSLVFFNYIHVSST